MAEIRIEHVDKVFGDAYAVRDANLVVADEEFLVLLGPSGCGKTTLLRTVAGLGMADRGTITIDGRDVTYLKPGERKISMVFQSYAIFPHMTVRDNIGFGLRMSGFQQDAIARNVDEAAELLHINDLLDRRPSDMSGGQRQRVAVARALAMKAEVLLMDEPLSNLDALLRLEMRAELKKLLADIGATTIYVTHDQIEALSMGDRIAVMRDGVIQQVGGPSDVYSHPTNRFVGSFIGNPPMNFVEGTVSRNGRGLVVSFGDNVIVPDESEFESLGAFEGRSIVMGIRAENMLTLSQEQPGALRSQVLVVEPLGAQNLVTVAIGGSPVKVSTHPTLDVQPNSDLWLDLPVEHIRWIDPESERVIVGVTE